jgi:hypothetical protein
MKSKMRLDLKDGENCIFFINDQNTVVNFVKIDYLLKYTSNWKIIQGIRVNEIMNWLKENHSELLL